MMTSKVPDVPLIWHLVGATLIVVIALSFVVGLICTFLLWLRDPLHRWPQTAAARIRAALAAERQQNTVDQPGRPPATSNVQQEASTAPTAGDPYITQTDHQVFDERSGRGTMSGELPF